MTIKPETAIVRACIAWVASCGGRAWHVNGSLLQPTGEPDIDGYIWSLRLQRVLHLKIEIKTPTGKVSPKQALRLLEYTRAGYVTGVATSVREFEQIIRDFENAQN